MAIEEKEEQTTSLKDLIELVEKDPLPSNVFTIEDKDPMVILGKLNEVIAYLKNLQATINASDSKANQALENAIKALSSASESLQASTTALNSSNLALETANLAIDTANTSLEGSNQAKTSSSEALDKANNALQIAQEALNQVTESLGSKVYDNNGNLKSNVKFAGHNGINVDLAEDNETFDIRLDEDITKAIEDTHRQAQANAEDIVNLTEMVADNTESNAIAHNRLTNVETNLTEINPKVARALLTPMSPPSQHFELVGVDTSNSQVMRKLGEGFAITNADTIIITPTNISDDRVNLWKNKLNTKVYAHYVTLLTWEIRVVIITDNNTPFTYSSLAQYLYNNNFTGNAGAMGVFGMRSNGAQWLPRSAIYSSNGTRINVVSSTGGGTADETLGTSVAFEDKIISIN